MTVTAYLDCNATTPLRPDAREAVVSALATGGNASAVHASGRTARQAVEKARAEVAELMGVAADGIVFTSGGTEANALALRQGGPGPVLVSAVEHASVRDGVTDGRAVETIPVDAAGRVRLGWLADRLAADPRPGLVSVMAANNETGVLQPLAEVARLCRDAGVLLHCDAVQMFGRLDFRPEVIGIDLVSVSSHKLGGPLGAGALWHRDGVSLVPAMRGGGQERGLRPGTENLPAIAGFGAAARSIAGDHEEFARILSLRDFLEAEIVTISPEAVVVAQEADRLPNTSCIAVPGLSAETALIALDLEGIAVSSGAACSSGKVGPSPVLAAMGFDEDLAKGALRLSLGWSTARAEAEEFLAAWRRLAPRLTRRGDASRAA